MSIKTFILLFITNAVFSQTADSLFVMANNFYKEGNIEQAIETYRKIESQNLVSSELYYNLGNCYYKLNKVGSSIYNYEKALQIDPLHKDVQNNLVFAKRLALDNIEEVPKSFLQKFNKNYLQKLSYNEWAVVVVFFSFLGSILFLLFYFSDIPAKKRLYFVTSIVSFLLLIVSIFITYNQHNISKNTIEAIIFAEKTEIKNAPTLNSEDIFTLHEGAKVFVLDAVDNWKKIKLADGKIGWILTDNLKEL
ncbi:MAG: tetratricopeptide repeat protein [Polaribacter sp.]